jgi:hypothetical protein
MSARKYTDYRGPHGSSIGSNNDDDDDIFDRDRFNDQEEYEGDEYDEEGNYKEPPVGEKIREAFNMADSDDY